MSGNNTYNTVTEILALCKFAGAGPRLVEMLLANYGEPEKIFSSDISDTTEIDCMTNDVMEIIEKARASLKDAYKYHTALTQREINIVTQFDPLYPSLLFELNDPPPLLYLRGKLPDNGVKSVTITGTEKATNEGIELTVKLARKLSEAGVQVVSSLACGIDAAVHLGCRAVNAKSYAIHNTGFDHIDQTEQIPLAIDVARSGGVITEYDPDREFHSSHLSATNRLLVGMTNAVVITEFYKDSSRTLDLISFCGQIGKMIFLMINPELGTLSDESVLDIAMECGVIPLVGLDKTDTIIDVLV